MAIVLKYGSPGPLLQAGFAAGVGKRKKDQTDDLLSVWQQQTQQGFQANQAALARQQQVGLQLQHQNFQADQNTLENYRADKNRFQQQDFQAEQAKLGREFQAGQTEKARQQQTLLLNDRQDAMQDKFTEEGLRKGQLELPPAAQKELQKLEEGRVLIQGPGWTDQDRAQFDADYQKRKSALMRMAQPKPQLSPEEQFQQNTFEKDGTLYQRTEKGLDVLKDSQTEKLQAAELKRQQETQAAEQKRQQAITTKADKLFAEKNDDASPKYKSYGEALKAADDMHREAASFFAGTSPSPSQAQEQTYTQDGQARTVQRRGQNTATQAGMTQGQWGDGQNGEPINASQPPPTLPESGNWQTTQVSSGREVLRRVTPEQAAGLMAAGTPRVPNSDEEAFNAQWATLQPGQSMKGPDGTIYIKKKAQ
jgi:hypothetical protein